MNLWGKLKNGATVLLCREAGDKKIVLAFWDGHHPYVTWRLDPDGNTFLGHYFADADEAMEDYRTR